MRLRFFPLLVALCCAAAGQGATPVVIRQASMRVRVDGRLATTTLELTYVNYTNDQREAILRFRLSPDAAVHELAMWVDGMRCPGAVVPHVTAERIYREIRHQRRDPALLTCLGNGQWALSVFPIVPHGTQKVQIVYSELLRTRGDALVWRWPGRTDGSTVVEAQDLEVLAEIRMPGGVRDVRAVTHNLGVQAGEPLTAGGRKENTSLETPVEFEIVPRTLPPQTVRRRDADGETYFAAVLPPPRELAEPPRRPRNCAILLDASGSMRGLSMEAAQAGAMCVLDRLDEQDRFSLIVFGSDVLVWPEDGPAPATAANKAHAAQWIRTRQAAGGTDLAAALRAADARNADPSVPLHLFVFTDGCETLGTRKGPPEPPADEDEKPSPATAQASRPAAPPPSRPAANCRVYACQIGQWSDGLDDLARMTGGRSELVYSPKQAAMAVEEFAAASIRPRVANLRLEVLTPDGAQAAPGEWGAVGLSPGESLVVAGRRTAIETVLVRLSAECDGKPFRGEYVLSLADAPGEPAPPELRQLWAHLRCETLWRLSQREDVAMDDLKAMIDLSTGFRVASRAATFLVLESDADYVRRGIRRDASMVKAPSALSQAGAALATTQPQQDEESRRLAAQARELIRLGRHDEALELMDQIARRGPGEFEATAQANLLREYLALKASVQARLKNERLSRETYARQLGDQTWHTLLMPLGATASVPLPFSAVGPQTVRIGPDISLEEIRLPKALSDRLPKVDFDNIEFKDVLRFLREVSGTSIYVKWKALESAGIEKTNPINVHLKDATFETVLKTVLEDVGGDNRLTFVVEDGKLTITTADDASRYVMTHVYDVRDILLYNRLYNEAMAGERPAAREPQSSGGLFGGPSDLDDSSGAESGRPSPSPAPGWRVETPSRAPASDIRNVVDLPGETRLPPDESALRRRRREPDWTRYLGADLRETIFSAVDPYSWAPTGDIGSIRQLAGQLVITQTQANHLAVVRLINQIRANLRKSTALPAGIGPTVRDLVEAEALFDLATRPMQWLAELLEKAREGKLSRYSSVRLAEAGGRQFASVGGIWIDTWLGASARVCTIVPDSPAAAALLQAAPQWKECFGLGSSVVVAVGGELGVCMGPFGAQEANDPVVIRILNALPPRPPTTEPRTRPKQ
ncbi:MAG TPA: VIT domain-containing protein [Phycisphaerae bacterium]|nr:VIT domain-containing protein [Phycisphaerae bacterium]